MNYTETFNDFAAKVGPTDLALYAGVGVILWVLFKDKLSPVQKLVLDLFNKFNGVKLPSVNSPLAPKPAAKEDLFFQLVESWKRTRDLAVKSNCPEAVKVADQMFPFLSPTACDKEEIK